MYMSTEIILSVLVLQPSVFSILTWHKLWNCTFSPCKLIITLHSSYVFSIDSLSVAHSWLCSDTTPHSLYVYQMTENPSQSWIIHESFKTSWLVPNILFYSQSNHKANDFLISGFVSKVSRRVPGTTYPSGATEFTPVSGVRVTRSLDFCVLFCRSFFTILFFFF